MKRCLFALLCFGAALGCAAATTFDSGNQHVALLELFTSEGCSSCPPAEAWLARLAHSGRLWSQVVPVAFHVDYWDNLGWKDRFASPENTARQRSYSAVWGSSSVYTPGFVVNGAEWKGWFNGQDLPLPANDHPGRLHAVLSDGKLQVDFESNETAAEAHCAPLAMGATSSVRAGENRGRELKHDFVALSVVSKPMEAANGHLRAVFQLPSGNAQAIAVWITAPGSLQSRQATGGLL
jgi:hypothetical protein